MGLEVFHKPGQKRERRQAGLCHPLEISVHLVDFASEACVDSVLKLLSFLLEVGLRTFEFCLGTVFGLLKKGLERFRWETSMSVLFRSNVVLIGSAAKTLKP